MQSNVKVTIGLCVKNSENTVAEAVESILEQDFPHELMELIVVDGHSKDRTVPLIRKAIQDSDIKARFFFDSKGLGMARQIVVDEAVGNYILWVDGDMVLPRDHVRMQVEFMNQNPKIGIAGGKFRNFPRENLIATLESIEWMTIDFMHGNKASLKPVLHRAGGCIYRTEAILEAGGLDIRIKGALEDLDIEHRIGERGWLTYFTTDAVFYDRRKETWKALWDENFWYGCGGHYFLNKHRKRLSSSKSLDGLRIAFVAYNMSGRKIVFLLPFQYVFKKIAWYVGFVMAHLRGYGHDV